MTSSKRASRSGTPGAWTGWSILILCLALVLLFLFQRSFESNQALFSNDGPLAVQVADPYHLPGAFLGIWNDLNWLGAHGGNFSPNITSLELMLLGPYGYTNFHVLIALLILASCAWLFFRSLGFGVLVCILASLAAALNMNFFSNGAWGLSSRALSLAMTFLALTAVNSSFKSQSILKTILAGLAIGMSISEGGDNGAIFSLFVAGFAFFMSVFHGKDLKISLPLGVGRVAIMAAFAALMALHILNLFRTTSVEGISAAQQDPATKARQWDFATQWSLPKLETLRVVIPGLFGYRMDTPDGGQYWGTVGQTPGWEPGRPGIARYSGAGEHAGVLVVLVAVWALVQSARREKSAFSAMERKQIWFWGGAALVALVLGWGRHAPFYQMVYALPYFSTIRNPMKFMHPCHMAIMILFAFGLQGLVRLYLSHVVDKGSSLIDAVKHVWRQQASFEKRWMLGSLATLGASVLAYLFYSTSRSSLVSHLTSVGFGPADAEAIAKFSSGEAGMFVVFLALSVAGLVAVQSGWFGSRRAAWVGVAFGLLLVIDLARSNLPWIRYYDYSQRYASNPVVDVLKDKPYEHRVAVMPFRSIQALVQLQNFYHVEWLQHHFQFYNIQALDVAQEPRLPEDKEAYVSKFTGNVLRYWQLSNTRYLLGLSDINFVNSMNDQLDPTDRGFQLKLPFTIFPTAKGHYGAAITNAGPFALLELTNALPRTKLYPQWEILQDNQATLDRLVSNDFDPWASVIVNSEIAPPESGATNAAPTQAAITDYSPREITIKTRASTPGVLLLNDRYHPGWEVFVDGQPQELLKCNFIMRGVQVPAGEHEVVFRFTLTATTFYITLVSVFAALLLCGLIVMLDRRTGGTKMAGDNQPTT